MNDKELFEFTEKALRSYFRQHYDSDTLYDAIIEKEEDFIKLLDPKQRIEFVKLRSMCERHADFLQQDSFSQGYFEGVGCNDTIKS